MGKEAKLVHRERPVRGVGCSLGAVSWHAPVSVDVVVVSLALSDWAAVRGRAGSRLQASATSRAPAGRASAAALAGANADVVGALVGREVENAIRNVLHVDTALSTATA